MKDRHVLVTTEFRGVFFGKLTEEKEVERIVVLENARCAIYWGTTHGFLELAEVGPNEKSKTGSVAKQIKLHGVTSITDCTEKAVEKWTVG